MLARTCAFFLSFFDLGTGKLPGLSRSGPRVNLLVLDSPAFDSAIRLGVGQINKCS